jgi:hypothetical protein
VDNRFAPARTYSPPQVIMDENGDELIPLTAAEARRLFDLHTALALPCRHHVRWSHWRRRHQARARWRHYGIADQTGLNGNLSADSLFVDSASNNFQLLPGSPAIGAGSAVDAPSVDFNGNPRPAGSIDIGAFQFTGTVNPAPCPPGTKANFRWHYTANGSAGGWSGTATQGCPGSFSMGPQAMDGNLQVTPGAILQAGYDFTLPGNTNSLTMTVSAAQVTFAVRCASGATPSASMLTVTMPDRTYQITNDQWYPSGDQSSPLVYQGSVSVPDLCGGGKISLAKGGTFTGTLG